MDIDNKKIVYDGCMVTFSGIVINLYKPFDNEYLLEDIAHGLAFNCRWNGATKTYFSVAEHCCMMHDKVQQHLKATALFHDCEEAYWGDLIKPLKNLLSGESRLKMRDTRLAIMQKFNIPYLISDIEAIDFELLQWDFENMVLNDNHVGWTCYEAEKQFLQRAKLYINHEQQ